MTQENLENLEKIDKNREIFLIKEATKKFETKFKGKICEVLSNLKEANLMEYKDHFTEIQIPENHTSSSLVRDLCEKGEFEKVKELVPRNVYEYLIRFYDVMNRM